MIKIRNTVRRTLFIVFLLLLSFTYASDRKGDFILKIETGNGKAVCFTLNPNEETFLFIYDQKHNLIYESAINKLDV
ncbi:hypothetical protein ABXT06_22210 [Flavobacterium sp. UW10123]|uniref:hypothetical protein n=1 Tax=Flavobacterium sp. UW10123 TaxID=3230800 RepID=UPI00339A7724